MRESLGRRGWILISAAFAAGYLFRSFATHSVSDRANVGNLIKHSRANLRLARPSGGCTAEQQKEQAQAFSEKKAGAPLVTFIVPSKGRDSIVRTLESLHNQTDDRWEAAIIFDGGAKQALQKVAALSYRTDPRIQSYTMPRMGEKNFAAIPRNFGMSKASSEWVAFVDDDDVLSCDYVTHLWEESLLKPSVETVIFRMSRMHTDLHVLPPKDDAMFHENQVGISFAVKRSLFEAGYWFRPSPIEDFKFLETVFTANKTMVISPHVTYYVKGVRPRDPTLEYPRHYLKKS